MKKIAILHYLPIEYYPPITNLLDYALCNDLKNLGQVKVFSCHNIKNRQAYIFPQNNLLNTLGSIYRSPFPKSKNSAFLRAYKYLHFNLSCLWHLILFKPNTLMYYETYSAWPAYVYIKYFNRKCKLFIHSHEYSPKEWYVNSMKLVKYFHRLEKKWLYPNANWNSQTNEDRLHFFLKDHPELKKESLRVMPNYPPKKWATILLNTKKIYTDVDPSKIKIVYVGSLSFEHTYLKEFCNWVIQQKNQVQFDIYSYNLSEEVKYYLNNLNCESINFYQKGIEYNELPKILSKYNVGIILYKAHNTNYTYNAPNKLFEYLVCDLDVWYSDSLLGPKKYITNNTYPQVIPICFEQMEQLKSSSLYNRQKLFYQPTALHYEEIFKRLLAEMLA